jgi:hypothetical protein
VVVVGSHDIPGAQPAVRQLSPALPAATHIEPAASLTQLPVVQ